MVLHTLFSIFLHNVASLLLDTHMWCTEDENFLTWDRRRTIKPCVFTLGSHIHNERASICRGWAWIVQCDWRFIQDTWTLLKISLYLWGTSSPPTAFPVELRFPVLLISSWGSGTAMAWLTVDCWRLCLQEEMNAEAGQQEVQETPTEGTAPQSATFSPDSGNIWDLIKIRISDTWHTNLLTS